MKESRTITLDAQGLYFRFLHHLSVKNKLKCTETCWSKEKVQSSFKGEEKKKKQGDSESSLLWEETAAELHYTLFKESVRKNPFLGRKKLEQLRESPSRHLIRE